MSSAANTPSECLTSVNGLSDTFGVSASGSTHFTAQPGGVSMMSTRASASGGMNAVTEVRPNGSSLSHRAQPGS